MVLPIPNIEKKTFWKRFDSAEHRELLMRFLEDARSAAVVEYFFLKTFDLLGTEGDKPAAYSQIHLKNGSSREFCP